MTPAQVTPPHSARPGRSGRSVVAALLVLILAAGAACGDSQGWAAKVGRGTVTVDELDSELEAIAGNRRYMEILEQAQVPVQGSGAGSFDMAFVAQVLGRQIFLEVVSLEVERRKIRLTPLDLRLARPQVVRQVGGPDPASASSVFDAFPREYRETLVRRSAEITALQASLGEVKIDEAAMRKYYEDNLDEMFLETCASHILVATKEKADELKGRLAAGEQFQALAAAESADPQSGQQGGRLDCITGEGNFVPQFEAALPTLAVGQVSDPVQTDFGFHLIRIDARRPVPFEQTAEEIRARILQPTQADLGRFLDTELGRTEIDVNPRYGRFDTTGEQPQVVPPEAPPTPTPGGGLELTPGGGPAQPDQGGGGPGGGGQGGGPGGAGRGEGAGQSGQPGGGEPQP